MEDDEWVVQMLWDCNPGCGRIANLGTHKNCEGCGLAIKDKKQWYSQKDRSYKNRIKDIDLQRRSYGGPDWKCGYCDGLVWNVEGQCVNCAGGQNPNKPSEIEQMRAKQIHPEERKPRPTHTAEPLPKIEPKRYDPDQDIVPNLQPASNAKTIAFAIAAGLLVITVLYFLFRTSTKDVTVESVNWKNGVHVSIYMQVNGSGFLEDQPSDAFDVKPEGKRRHHDKKERCGTKEVKDKGACGETCVKQDDKCKPNDNGTETCRKHPDKCTAKTCKVPKYCEVPVMQDWYEWHLMRWKPNRWIFADGTTTETRWPSEEQIALNKNIFGREKEKISERTSEFTAKCRDKEGNVREYHPTTDEEFKTYPPGSRHRMQHSIARGLH